MSIVCEKTEQRMTTAEAIDRLDVNPVEHGGPLSLSMPVDEDGRIEIQAPSDIFPAARIVAKSAEDGFRKVAAYLLRTVCGWSCEDICEGLELSGKHAAVLSFEAGERLMRERTVRL